MMKNSQLFLVLVLLFASLQLICAQKKGGNSVKGNISFNVTSNIVLKYKSVDFKQYGLDASYGFSNHFDGGLYFTTDLSGTRFNELGVLSRYFLTSYIFKRPVKVDFYLKGYCGSYWQTIHDNMGYLYSSSGFNFGAFGGVKYFPIEWMGIMTEAGYNNYYLYNNSHFMITFGLSFRIE